MLETAGRVEIEGPTPERGAEVLTSNALLFVAALSRRFEERRRDLLRLSQRRQGEFDEGRRPDFPAETRDVREGRWTVAPIPPELEDRRVEIVGPADRATIAAALDSPARAFVADLEDGFSPTWTNIVRAHVALRDAAGRPTLMVRPRGLRSVERHLLVDGTPVAAAFFDFGLFFFHNANRVRLCFCLPKLEGRMDARLWADIFRFAEDFMSVRRGTIRATAIIETVPAAFEMHEILYELREHAAGLCMSQWGYVGDFLMRFRRFPEFALPDRSQVTMADKFLKSCDELMVRTCHARRVHALGGAPAEIAVERTRAEMLREVRSGHDGGWVSDPALVPVAMSAYEFMLSPNQIGVPREDVRAGARDLLAVPVGVITQSGVRTNVAVALRYLDVWLGGVGRLSLYGRCEDAATANAAAAQVWHWLRHGARTVDGAIISERMVREFLREETEALVETDRLELAARLVEEALLGKESPDSLTISACRFWNQ